MREKTRISYWFFGKWCACATSLYLWPYVVHITSRAAVGWFRRRSRTTWPKTRIIPARLEQAFTLAKKNLKNRQSFKKSHSGGGFFDSGFFAVFRGSCLATSHEKPECTKDSGFLMQGQTALMKKVFKPLGLLSTGLLLTLLLLFNNVHLEELNPSRTTSKYTQVWVYGKCVLKQNWTISNG